MKKRYWLKAGIITSVIGVILTMISMKIEIDILSIFVAPFNWGGMSMVFVGCSFWNASKNCISIHDIFGYVATIICYFIIGMIIGWIYGKVKNREINIQ